MWAHGRPRPPSGSMGAEPRPHPLAGLDNPPAHRPGACARPCGSVGCPPPDAPPTLISKFPEFGIGPPLLPGRQVVGGAVAGVQPSRGEACLPGGVWGLCPLPWSRHRRRAGRRGEAEARSAPLPFLYPPAGGLLFLSPMRNNASSSDVAGRKPAPFAASAAPFAASVQQLTLGGPRKRFERSVAANQPLQFARPSGLGFSAFSPTSTLAVSCGSVGFASSSLLPCGSIATPFARLCCAISAPPRSAARHYARALRVVVTRHTCRNASGCKALPLWLRVSVTPT